MVYLAKLGILCLVLSCLPTFIAGQDACVKTGPCRCVFSNGTGIDLTPAAKDTFYSAEIFTEKKEGMQLELSTYYYHPCYDVIPKLNKTSTNDTCNKPLSICRRVVTLDYNANATMYKMDGGVSNYMGNTNDSFFVATGDSIVYKNVPSETIVRLICAQTDDKLHINSLVEPNQVVLDFYSRSACMRELGIPDEGGRSFGSTLLIIFFSVLIFYIVLGVCTKKFLMGATGIEVIPNLAFWSDLPNLVKDGWAFMLNGFKLPVRGAGPAMSPDPNSYDSI